MKPRPKLHIVAEQPIDISALIRADANARDWSRCHIEGDRRAPVFLPDAKGGWR
jgi:hypothetical protein